MTAFDPKYFQKFNFSHEQIERYFNNALRDLRIAKESCHDEVKFSYSFNSLIKAGIALIASKGGVKVRSVPGHHVKIIEKLSEFLNDETVLTIGNAMRMKRNEDFYGGGIFISEKEAKEYLDYISGVLDRAHKMIVERSARGGQVKHSATYWQV